MSETKTTKIEQSPRDTAIFLYNIFCMRGEYPITSVDVEKVINHLLNHAAEHRENSKFPDDIHIKASNEFIRMAVVINLLYQLGRTASRKWKNTYRFNE